MSSPTASNNCSAPIPAGSSCVTSADCCGNPCVDNKCGSACVQKDGKCTANADCCAGLPCAIPTGSTSGICGGTLTEDGGVTTDTTDGGTTSTCSLYGQSCVDNASCCDSVPCTSGTCRYP